MCGIVGIAAKEAFSVKDDLLRALKKLEYRGYDSVGFAASGGMGGRMVRKDVGEIDRFVRNLGPEASATATVGIAHTRWATHGTVTQKNAHPHWNRDKTLFAVHNGIIENFEEMRQQLKKRGCEFMTETDSEIIPHFIDYQLRRGSDMQKAMQAFIRQAKGTFAILIMRKGDDAVYAMKRDSPLALGICEGAGRNMLGSDIYAFSHKTNKAIFFDDDEYAVVKADTYELYKNGRKQTKQPTTFEWAREEETKKQFRHFMLKEVFEQPVTSKRLLTSLETAQRPVLKRLMDAVRQAGRVVFVSAGTSYHASLIGALLMRKLGIEAHTVIASEFENFIQVDKNTLVIAISQSGETMDVVAVLKDIRKTGAKTAAIVNVPYSTIQRLSDISVELMAGQEICVAATKSFTNQVLLLLALANGLGHRIDLKRIPQRIRQVLEENEPRVRALAKKLYKRNDIFVIGRGMSYPIAREIALKLKEISYVHAEGMMGGELKHGTIALIEKGTPVMSLIHNRNPEMVSNTKEVEARGAKIIIISDTLQNSDFLVPECGNGEFAIYACMIGHLLSYYIALERKLPIDKPRNLAKSVTVK